MRCDSLAGVITADGSVYTWGHGGRFGRLGHGCTAACPEPRLLSAVGPRVHMLAGGESHMLALCRDSGIVFSWGDNTYGQLGHSMAGLEADNQWLTPRQIDFFIDLRAKHRRSGKKVTITHIASGTVHSLCGVSISCGIAQRDIISEIYSWGSNERGQLGIKQVNLSRSHSHVPSKVKFPGEMQSNEGTSVQIIDLTAACYNSLVVLAHQKTRFGVFATSADSASMLENRNYATNDIYQFGNGVFSPFRINPLWSESCFSEESDNSICARCPDKYYTRVAVSVFTSLDLSAAIFLDGSVFLWSVPRASKNSKPTLELLPNQLVQLSRKRLGIF